MTKYYDNERYGGVRRTVTILARKTLDGEVNGGQTRIWTKESFLIPDFHHGNITGCKIIKQSYHLEVKPSRVN